MDESSPSEEKRRSWDQWPLCPSCEKRRQARCDSCQYASEEFPLADYLAPMELSGIGSFKEGEFQAAGEEQESVPMILLMCPRCEEAFPPKFYAKCQWCGHDFEQGYVVDAPATDHLTPQAIWTLFGLILFGLAALAWFWWVTNP